MVYQHATRQVGDGTAIVILRWPPGQRHKAERVTRSWVLAITPRPLVALDHGDDIAFKLGAEGEAAAATLAAQLTLAAELDEANQRIKTLADELLWCKDRAYTAEIDAAIAASRRGTAS